MKWFKNTIALLFFSAGTLLAQTSIPAVSEPEFPGRPDVMKVYSEAGYTAYRNAIGTIPLFVTRNATADSLEEQKWIVTVDRTSRFQQAGLHYQHIVTVEGTLVNDPSHRTVLYKDTVDMSSATAELQVPDRDTRTTTTGNPFPFYRDSLFSVWLREDTLYSGDKTEIFFTRYVPAAADSTGQLSVRSSGFRVAELDTLTILTHDTLRAELDTTYSIAFPSHFEMTEFIDAVTPNATTGTMFGHGIQLKFRGVNAWFAPALTAPKKFWVMDDSLNILTGDSLIARVDSLPPADSVRVVIWGKSNLGRVIIRWVKVLFRD